MLAAYAAISRSNFAEAMSSLFNCKEALRMWGQLLCPRHNNAEFSQLKATYTVVTAKGSLYFYDALDRPKYTPNPVKDGGKGMI